MDADKPALLKPLWHNTVKENCNLEATLTKRKATFHVSVRNWSPPPLHNCARHLFEGQQEMQFCDSRHCIRPEGFHGCMVITAWQFANNDATDLIAQALPRWGSKHFQNMKNHGVSFARDVTVTRFFLGVVWLGRNFRPTRL